MRSEGVYTRNDLASRIFGSRDTVSYRETKGKTRLTLSNSLALVKVNGTELNSNKVYCILSWFGDLWTTLLPPLDCRYYQATVSLYGCMSIKFWRFSRTRFSHRINLLITEWMVAWWLTLIRVQLLKPNFVFLSRLWRELSQEMWETRCQPVRSESKADRRSVGFGASRKSRFAYGQLDSSHSPTKSI